MSTIPGLWIQPPSGVNHDLPVYVDESLGITTWEELEASMARSVPIVSGTWTAQP